MFANLKLTAVIALALLSAACTTTPTPTSPVPQAVANAPTQHIGDTCGVEVHVFEAELKDAALLHEIATGHEAILFTDRALEAYRSYPMLVDFVLEHECGHRLRKHNQEKIAKELKLRQAGITNPEEIESFVQLSHRQEFESDCFATRVMIRTGRAQGVKSWLQYLSQQRPRASHSHPDWESRTKVTKFCAAKEGVTL